MPLPEHDTEVRRVPSEEHLGTGVSSWTWLMGNGAIHSYCTLDLEKAYACRHGPFHRGSYGRGCPY